MRDVPQDRTSFFPTRGLLTVLSAACATDPPRLWLKVVNVFAESYFNVQNKKLKISKETNDIEIQLVFEELVSL